MRKRPALIVSTTPSLRARLAGVAVNDLVAVDDDRLILFGGFGEALVDDEWC
jgi:hypothetical protein